jgi:hypothetical protein
MKGVEMKTLHPACQNIRQRILAGDWREVTKQEIFDAIAQHTFQQGGQAVIDGMCAYRGPDNTCCNVGAIIPNEVFDPKWDGMGDVENVIKGMETNTVERESLKNFLSVNKTLFSALQKIHDNVAGDNWYTTDTMRGALRKIQVLGVSTAIVDTLSFGDR